MSYEPDGHYPSHRGSYPPQGGDGQHQGHPPEGSGGHHQQYPQQPQPYGRQSQHGHSPYGAPPQAPSYDTPRHDGRPYDEYEQTRTYERDYQPASPPQRPRRPSRARRWIIAGASVLALAGIGAGVMAHYEIPPFTDKGKDVSFDTPTGDSRPSGQKQSKSSKVLMPTGPKASFKNAKTLDDGTHIAVTTLEGGKSGFKGKVWVWAPKQYFESEYANSGFPVMIALPGGPGYPTNYWMGADLGLQTSIAEWSKQGKSKPFILAMPVLNPGPDDGGLYWDGSDIPGQPKMGTWLTEDVPNLIKANFRTIKSRDGWAFMGSSTGGFASLKAVLKHPDKFKAAIASGPDIVPDSRLWKGHEKEKAQNNPKVLAKELIAKGGPDVYLAFQVGTAESNANTLPDVKSFIAAYGKGPIHTSLLEIQGGKHSARTYVPNMGKGPIQFISEVMEGPVSD
ncbi:alpha/beta hydrolase-fold protein [Streptomyces sp. NPDC051907]|uniref:alpha/beta hydrolase n=1 Tax=Streptomyces sp. NPDC051907 TaxID=3155284 RepID=UPI00341B02CF